MWGRGGAWHVHTDTIIMVRTTKCMITMIECRIRSRRNQHVLHFLLDVSKIAYIDTDQYVYYSYALGESTTHTTNHNSAHNTVITMIKRGKM